MMLVQKQFAVNQIKKQFTINQTGLKQKRERLCTCAAIKYSDLRLWQLNKMEEAFQQGKRKVKINTLSKELGFERREVLEWFKYYESMPQERRESLRSTLEATEKAKQTRKNTLLGKKINKKSNNNNLDSWQEVKDVKRIAKRDRISKDAQRTLEMIFSRWRHPSDEIVREIQKMHWMPRKKVLDWFAQKRRGEID
eukprot:TRINITY_DN238_c1_g1_i2.p2 TRINITY_DN238_c1_g1~~TRINITY_DN238_c1_g1_i2.p2  ORF type:complete len:196 (+),score=28.53 TRINITY_DN238_c1_g1_i2:68-655(+)